MKPDHDKVEDLLNQALEFEPEQRAAFLTGACGSDQSLRDKVATLLKAHDEASGFLPEAPVARGGFQESESVTLTAVTEKPGECIGRYKLLQKIGEGGCGVVYMAEQEEPVRRRVALKVIKLGMDTKSVITRFEAERQALALMDHPNIAKVLDAGATASGRPYFVMELVRGVKITEYCDASRLSTRERLDLFIKVCQAIQHAHQKGIIHRDIKPSNILVTINDGVAVPKVIDFGIAKATEGRLTDKTFFTQFEALIGTPAYMSPEQAVMTSLDVDTRSDIYSLGVLLYELLAGSTPFDAEELMASGIDAMRKTIREKEPVRPSTRLATLQGDELTTTTKRRSAETSKLMHQLKGDLDWIVMKCLEKDPARRYETANGLAADLERHLSNEAVLARPPSAVYRFQKAWRRNKLVYSAGVAIATVLVIAAAVTTWQAVRAIRAQGETERARLGEHEQRLAAQVAQREAEVSRSHAVDARLTAQRNLYAAEMVLASQAMEKGNLGQVRRLLAKYARTQTNGPAANETLAALRGWEWRHLWQRSRGDERFILRGHAKSVPSALVLSDNQTILSGSEDGTLRFWNVEQQAPIETISFGDDVFCLARSADSRWLVIGGNLGHWSLWSLADRREVMGHTNATRVAGVAFSPDNQHFAIADGLGVEVWNAGDQRRIKVIPRTSFGFMLGLAYSPDGQTLAYSLGGYSLVLHDLPGGTQTIVDTDAILPVLNLTFSPDHRFLVGASASEITVWDSALKIPVQKLTNHSEQVTSLAFSPDGTILASGSGDQTVRLWDTQTWQETAVLRGHAGQVHSVSFSPNGEFLISSGKDATVRVWKTQRSDRHPDQFPWPKEITNFLPKLPNSERMLYQLGSNRWSLATLFDNATFSQGASKRVPTTLQRAVTLAADVSVNWLAADLGQGQVELWRTDPFEQRESLAVGPGALHSLAVGRTGGWLAFKRPNHTAEIWNVARKGLQKTLAPLTFDGESEVRPLTFWASDRRLAHFGKSREPHGHIVDIVLLPEGETRRIISTHKSELCGLAISADGELLATSAWDGEVKLWSVDTGQEMGTLAGQLIGFTCLGFSSDGARLAAGGYDGTITVWDVSTGQQVAHWMAHRAYCTEIIFLDHDQKLVSVGDSTHSSYYFETRTWRAPTLSDIDAAEAKEQTEIQQP